MAQSSIAQPALYIDTYPTCSQKGELFTVEFQGITLKLTPHAALGLIMKTKQLFADWNAINNAKAAGIVVEEPAEVVAFPKRPKIVRSKGEAM